MLLGTGADITMSGIGNDINSSPGRGRARGRGLDTTPLRKPNQNASRPGSLNNSPRRAENQEGSPKSTVSDSVVKLSCPQENPQSSLNAKAAEFVPRATKSQPSLVVDSSYQSPNEFLVSYIENALTNLLSSPSHFERVSPQLSHYFTANLIDEQSMTIASDVIFEWAITQPNFGYTCGRLIQDLSSSVPNNHNGLFLQHVIKRCHFEHKEHAVMVRDDPERLRLFTIFIAELYTRIDGPDGRLIKLMNAILELVYAMLDNIDNLFAKTVGQTLKLCGASLEDDLSSSGKTQKMDELMAQLTVKAGENYVMLIYYALRPIAKN